MNSPFGNLGDADTYLARAELMFDLDRFDEARDELGGALSADPAHLGSLTLLAILELQVGNHDDALTAASSALAAEPTHDTAQLARGHALALLHRADEAIDVANQIQQRNPESWWHNVHYALIVRESRNGQDSLDAAWLAVKLAGEDARAHLTLAQVSAGLGLTDLAERALAAADRLDPGISTLIRTDLGPQLLRGSPQSARRTHAPDSPAAAHDTPPRATLPDPVRSALRVAGGFSIGIPILTACISGGQENTGRIVAGLASTAAIIGLVILFQRLPDQLRESLRSMIDADKLLGLGVALAVCGPLLSGVFAFTGATLLLAVTMAAGFATMAVAFLRGR